MPGGRKRILSPFTRFKQRRAWNKSREKYMPEERRQNLAETGRGLYYNQEKWLEELLDDKGAFYNGSEIDDRNNDDENYNENNEQQLLPESFANSCYKIVSPTFLQELINDFVVCKHCNGTLLLVEDVSSSHAFGN